MEPRKPSPIANPWLILAPHNIYPTRNGADISMDRVAKYLSYRVPYVDLICEAEIIRYQKGNIIRLSSFKNKQRDKVIAALRALIFQSNYLLEKFNTGSYKRVARSYLEKQEYATIVLSFNTTIAIIDGLNMEGRNVLVWTHNDDYKWFLKLKDTLSNPLVKVLSDVSINWIRKTFEKSLHQLLFLHVSDSDRQGYLREHPSHKSIIVPIGVDIPPSIERRETSNSLIVAFVGSLNLNMNIDALSNFKETYYVPIQRNFPECKVRIIGSNPTKVIVKMCKELNWELHANVTNETLDQLVQTSTFTIMPFKYNNGAKLKFLTSIANGTPVLATRPIKEGLDETVPFSLFSNSIEDWIEHIKENIAVVNLVETKNEIHNYAKQFSWQKSVDVLFSSLDTHFTDI